MIQQLMSDPIIEEIHRTRRDMSDKFNGDFVTMLKDARRRQEVSGGKYGSRNHRARRTSVMEYHLKTFSLRHRGSI